MVMITSIPSEDVVLAIVGSVVIVVAEDVGTGLLLRPEDVSSVIIEHLICLYENI